MNLRRVLIVDDKEENLYLLESLLKGHGCTVDSARHGAEALTRARRERPDLVVADLLMPVMDGYTLLRHWKADSRLQHIPFVVYTATYTEPQDQQLALDLGADAFILKPAEPAEFMARLRQVMETTAQQQAARAAAPDGPELMQTYSATLIRKLEEKSLQLEEANRRLQRDIADRRRAEELLSASEAARRAVWQSSLDAIVTMDPHGLIQDFNPAAERMFGYARDKVLGRPMDRVLIPPELREAHRRGLKRHLETGESRILGRRFEQTALRADGSRFPVEIAVVAIPGGARPAFIGAVRDITERKAAEQSLRASEERFRQLAESIEEVFWLTDPDKRQMLYVSPAYERIWGRPVADLHRDPLSWVEAIHVEDRARVLEAVALQADGRYDIEYRILRPDGSLRWIADRAFPLRDERGVVWRIAGVARDVTQRRRAAEQLAEQAELLDKARDAIFLRDLDGRVIYWNRSAERLYGWSAQEALGREATALCYGDPGPGDAAIVQVMERGEWTGEAEQRSRDGRKLTVECRLNLIRDAAGRPRSVLAINTDVTEKRRLEAQFLRAQRMESIGTLAGGIAHDLNNVLTPILVSLELLRANEQDADRLRILANVQASANRGADMIRQLLSFTRGVEGVHAAVNLARIGREIGKIARDTFPKNIEFRCEAEPGLWSILGDATQLHQVLLNLCVNARDAMPQGGTLELKLRNRSLDAVQAGMCGIARPGHYLEATVRDTGTGIPPHVQERMFEPFFTTKEPGQGTGLGLATVLSIVKSHNGFINVYSEEGKGATFRLYLPAGAHPEATEQVETQPVVLPRGRGETILVVDDDESIRMIAGSILERHGYRARYAANGAEALAQYRAHAAEIALVLTDMAMPVMDGPAAVTALRRLDPALRVVCCSGLASNTDLAQVQAAGVRHFVPKPYTAATILSAIRRALDEPA